MSTPIEILQDRMEYDVSDSTVKKVWNEVFNSFEYNEIYEEQLYLILIADAIDDLMEKFPEDKTHLAKAWEEIISVVCED